MTTLSPASAERRASARRRLTPEELAAEVARLDVQTATARQYLDWYGGETVTVRTREGLLSIPAYEFFIREDVTGTLLQRHPLLSGRGNSHFWGPETVREPVASRTNAIQ